MYLCTLYSVQSAITPTIDKTTVMFFFCFFFFCLFFFNHLMVLDIFVKICEDMLNSFIGLEYITNYTIYHV